MNSTAPARRLALTVAFGTVIALGQATHVVAQAGSEDSDEMKAYLVDAFERAKAWDVSLAEAIPDSALDWAPSPDVRGFAEQVIHAANNSFISTYLFGETAPAFGDEEALAADRGALIAAITTGYDWLIERLGAMSAADLAQRQEFFGSSMSRARIALFALEHAMWTRGQLVPYLHAHGVPVPQVQLF